MIEPGSAQELAAELKNANEQGLAVAPRGGGTKQEWGNPAARSDVTLSTAKLSRVVEHAWSDLTATVEAGCTVAVLQQTLAEHGQRLAIDALWPERATIGGIVSANDSGALRLRYGGLRDLIIGVTLALPDGTLAKSGGKVVKNVAGYDLPKLATGAMGTLGVITEAVFRLHSLPPRAKTLLIRPADLEDAQRTLLAIQNSQLAHSALQLRTAGGAPEMDVLLEGTEAGISAQESFIRKINPNLTESDSKAWASREQLWDGRGPIVKFSVLPSAIGKTVAVMGGFSAGCRAVVQATGLGWARFERGTANTLLDLRRELQATDGSLVVLRQAEDAGIETWGPPGDAFKVMQAVKRQFDPKGTLNPGRFVGGI